MVIVCDFISLMIVPITNSSLEFKEINMKEYYTNCCHANFVHPGWPDNDMCSECFEHADIGLIIGEKDV